MFNSNSILSKYISANAIHLVNSCWQKYPFALNISSPRKTKLGDYKLDFITGKHYISINNDLKPDAFLFTFLHEIAHQHTTISYGRSVKPHGEEWRNIYRNLLLLALKNDAFENAHIIIQSLDQLKSSSVFNPSLFKQLYLPDDSILLEDIPNGKHFILNGTPYLKLKTNRSRCVCKNLIDQKDYFISKIAQVKRKM